jgi:glycerol dehydrogenase-like iron-containing ADH family enzyme
MAEDRQPADIVEGATSGDVEDEVQPTAKSAEDRKAAAALSKLDARGDDEGASREVDQEAVNNAMSSLGGGAAKKEVKAVKVDAADVKLLVSSVPTFLSSDGIKDLFASLTLSPEQVDELELPKPKATELLKAHDGDAVKALKAYLQPNF